MCLVNITLSTGTVDAYKIFRLRGDQKLGAVFNRANHEESYEFGKIYTASGTFLHSGAEYGPMFHAFKELETAIIVLAEIVGTIYWAVKCGQYVIRKVKLQGDLAEGYFETRRGIAGRTMSIYRDSIWFFPTKLQIFLPEVEGKVANALSWMPREEAYNVSQKCD
jgi:hypothetical protein